MDPAVFLAACEAGHADVVREAVAAGQDCSGVTEGARQPNSFPVISRTLMPSGR